ncbi:MAG: TetR family transcriptional regulator [Streptosporangiales bacterium]|nr:TetR family transcriptional regulator [Streptosporangiales bacterium]
MTDDPPKRLDPLLRAVLEAFEEHGFHGASVRDIAGRAGVTVPALYYHYASKQGMLAAILVSSVRELLRVCEAALEVAPKDPRSRLAALARQLVLSATHSRHVALLDRESRNLSEADADSYRKARGDVQDLVTAAVTEGAAGGVFRTDDPRDTARAILSLCLNVANWYQPTGPMTATEIADRYVIYSLRLAGDPDAD